MSEEPHFLGEIRDGVAWVTFNRPKVLNAYSVEMRDAFIPFLRKIEHDDSVRCLVLKGAGTHFMAGGDVKAFTEEMVKSPEDRRAVFEGLCHAMHPIIYLLRRLPKPVVASVAGACAGLGVSFVLASDLAIAADTATFTMAYVKIGTTPDGGASYFLPRTVGMKRAMEIALLSDRLDATAAERLGLINRVVPLDQLETETRKLALRLSTAATGAVARTKALLSAALLNDLETHLQQEAVNFAACTTTEDMVEGVTAFMQKRPPTFNNR